MENRETNAFDAKIIEAKAVARTIMFSSFCFVCMIVGGCWVSNHPGICPYCGKETNVKGSLFASPQVKRDEK